MKRGCLDRQHRYTASVTCPQFIRHTSASLLIQENASPSVRVNLEHWLNRLAPEDHNPYPHTRDVS
ncbi:Uncharacterised protein family UPF0047 [Microbulbifer thermotolerans]|nr:Uncharacterised protein family UPF0047 [Microbulbifer thermotolerans]